MQIIKTRILMQLALCLLGGVLFYFYKSALVPAVLIGIIGYSLWEIAKIHFWKELVIRIILSVGAFVMGVGSSVIDGYLFSVSQAEIKNTGTIIAKELKNDKLQLTVKPQKSLYKMLVYVDETDLLSVGDVIRVEGEINEFQEPRNEGEFQEKKYYRSRHIIWKTFPKSVDVVRKCKFSLGEKSFRLKQRINKIYKSCLEDGEAGIISAIVTGEKANTSVRIKDIFRNAGLSHILSISGMHISLLAGGLMWFFKWSRMNNKVKIVLELTMLTGYGFFCGMSVSTVRALVMAGIAMTGGELRRNYDRLTALSVLLMCTLSFSPYMIFNSGFVFSYLITFFLIIIGELKIKNKLLVAVLLQLFSLPVVAYFYYEIPVFSFLVNLCLVPYIGVVMTLGILGGIVGLMFMPLARVVLWPVEVILKVYIFCCEKIDELPFSCLLTGCPRLWQIVVYYAVLIAILYLGYWIRNNINRTSSRACVYAITGLLGVAMMWMVICAKPEMGMEVDFLDVGQGDSIFVRAGGNSYFIDGGSTDVKNVGKYRISPFLKYKGIDRVDYWIVSHADLDHVSGLLEILKNENPPKNIVLSKYIVKNENLENLYQAVSEKNINVIYVGTEDIIGKNELCCKFIWPVESGGPDVNGNSLVSYIKYKDMSVLLTGDISSEEEKKIINTHRDELEKVNVYKAAHHGSKYANSVYMLEHIKPEVSVISCGFNNRYGHPGEEAVRNMESYSNRVYRTDLEGQIKCVYRHNKLLVSKMR